MALNNMGGLGITININVNAPGAQQTTQSVTAGLNQVAAAGSRAAQAAGGARQQFANLAGEFTKMVVGKHLIGLFSEMAMKADEVTQGMANIKSYMLDSIDPVAMVHLKSTMMDVAETTGKSFADVSTAAKELISHGLSVEAVENILGPLTKFQTVSGISAEKATDLTMALTNMGIASDKVGQAFDVMMNLTSKTPIRAAEFTDVLIKAAPAATLAKQSFLEIASSAAILRKSFTSGKEEATALFQTISTLERTKIQDKLKKAFGVDVATDKNGGLKPLLNIIQDVNTAIQHGHGSIRDLYDIFGSRTGSKVFAGGIQTLQAGMQMGGQNRMGQDLIDSTREAAGVSVGAVDKAFDVKMINLTAQIERLKVAFGDLIATFGGQFANSLTAIVQGVDNLIQGFRKLLEMNPVIKDIVGVLVSTGAKLALVVGGMLVLSGGVKIASLAFANLRTSLFGVAGAAGVAGTAAKGFWRSLLGPIGIALTVISLVSDIFGLFKEGEAAQDKSLSVADSLKQTAFANSSAADKLAGAADALEQATLMYKELVVQYTKLFVNNFPSMDITKSTAAVTQAEKFGKFLGISEADSKEVGDKILKMFKPGADLDTKTISEASRAINVLSASAAAAVAAKLPGADKALKQLHDMQSAIEEMTKAPMVQATKDINDLRRGLNPAQEDRAATPHGQRLQRVIEEGASKPLILNGHEVSLQGVPRLRDLTTRRLEVERTGNTFTRSDDPIYNERGNTRPVRIIPTVIDKPVELKVDGNSVGASLRMSRQQDDVESLRSP